MFFLESLEDGGFLGWDTKLPRHTSGPIHKECTLGMTEKLEVNTHNDPLVEKRDLFLETLFAKLISRNMELEIAGVLTIEQQDNQRSRRGSTESKRSKLQEVKREKM